MNKLYYTILFFLGLTISLNAQKTYLSQVGETHEIYSEVLGEARTFYVQLPDGYDPGQAKKYPVVYLIDGESLMPALYTVHQFYSGGFMPEMVLIGIDNSKNRNRDLTSSSVDMLFGRPAKESTGKAAHFLEFLKTELIPHVEANLPVTSYRTLIGHSYGGHFSIFALMESPETFANVLAIDPSLQWDNQNLQKSAEAKGAQIQFQNNSLFISLNGQLHGGDPTVTIDNVMEDESFATQFARANISFSKLLETASPQGLEFDWKFYPRDLHGTIPLPSMMDGLISIFEWFQMEEVHKFNDFETPVAELDRIIKYRAEKLESKFGQVTPPYPADLMYHMSFMCMDMGQFDKAKMFLDHYLQFYPESAGPYEATAEYYERKKSKAKALEYAEKAYEISGSSYHKEKVERLKK